jgi:hypothetical protein
MKKALFFDVGSKKFQGCHVSLTAMPHASVRCFRTPEDTDFLRETPINKETTVEVRSFSKAACDWAVRTPGSPELLVRCATEDEMTAMVMEVSEIIGAIVEGSREIDALQQQQQQQQHQQEKPLKPEWATVKLRSGRAASPAPRPATAPAEGDASLAKAHRQQTKRTEHRSHVCQEILASEKSYVESLATMVEVYMTPMAQGVPGQVEKCDPLDVQTVFGDVEQILTINRELLTSLEERMKTFSVDTVIGDLFVKLCPFFKLYSAYSSGFERATKKLEQMRAASPALAAWLDAQGSGPRCRGLSLPSFLIMPVQRVPRYLLLLGDLEKNTWAHHADSKTLAKALAELRVTAAHINESVRRQESAARMAEIHGRVFDFDGDLIQPTRVYQSELALRIVKRNGHRKERVAVLFNDLLLLCMPKAHNRLKFKESLTLGPSCWVRALPAAIASAPAGLEHAAQVITDDETIILLFASASERINFTALLENKAIGANPTRTARCRVYQAETKFWKPEALFCDNAIDMDKGGIFSKDSTVTASLFERNLK